MEAYLPKNDFETLKTTATDFKTQSSFPGAATLKQVKEEYHQLFKIPSEMDRGGSRGCNVFDGNIVI